MEYNINIIQYMNSGRQQRMKYPLILQTQAFLYTQYAVDSETQTMLVGSDNVLSTPNALL